MPVIQSRISPVVPVPMEPLDPPVPDAHSFGTRGLGSPTILIVDDEESFRGMLHSILKRGGYDSVLLASSHEEALRIIGKNPVDLLLTDMQMPGGSGLKLLGGVHTSAPHLATLMITGTDDPILAEAALAVGAYGYLVKPVSDNEVLIGISNALRRRSLELENEGHREHLEQQVKMRGAELWTALQELATSEGELRSSRAEMIERLATAAELRDEETGKHVIRMSRFSEALARAAGMDPELQGAIREAASLHDLGKIGIPDSILLKPGSHSPEERLVMQQHAEIGHRILADSHASLLKLAAEIALTHHEKFDGTGYPHGLVGDSIPLSGRIAAIADVFDALTTDRVYRPAFGLVTTVKMMKNDSGTHFDPVLLDTFLDILPEILEISEASLEQPRLPHDEPVLT